jgi:hypothetical protein
MLIDCPRSAGQLKNLFRLEVLPKTLCFKHDPLSSSSTIHGGKYWTRKAIRAEADVDGCCCSVLHMAVVDSRSLELWLQSGIPEDGDLVFNVHLRNLATSEWEVQSPLC